MRTRMALALMCAVGLVMAAGWGCNKPAPPEKDKPVKESAPPGKNKAGKESTPPASAACT